MMYIYYTREVVCAVLIFSCSSALALPDRQTTLDPHFHVKSWKALRDDGIVKQNLDYSCGAASIATLLNQYYGTRYSEEDILSLLGKNKQGASFADMQRIMPSLGFQAEGYALSFAQLQRIKIPVIVYLHYRKNDHFSVLRGIDGNTVLLADPSLGHVSMSKEQFMDAWHTRESDLAGKILAIVPQSSNKELTQQSSFFTKSPRRKTQHIWQDLQISPKLP